MQNFINVGLRGYYICTVFASRLMTKRRTGLIVFVSSLGGLKYFLNVPYGGKFELNFT
jgi:dehydrogenase/reductase SDR family protein 1